MTAVVGMRELSRNTKLLEQYDYVDVEDKKTHEYKGLFISPKYADEFKKLLEKKILSAKQNELNELMKFVGMSAGDTKQMTAQEIRTSKKDKYIDE
jgi:hypothetical protein